MSTPDNGAEKIYFVLGKTCIQVFEWNEHYIKEDTTIENLIIFDVSEQKYFNWEEFINVIHKSCATLGVSPSDMARRHLKRLRYKAYLPVELVQRKKVLKTKKKIENKFVSTPSGK